GIHHRADDSACVDRTPDRSVWVGRVDRGSLVRTAMFLEIPPGDSVLHRYDRRGVVAEISDVLRDRANLMRLDRKDDDILRSGVAHLVEDRDAVGRSLTRVLADDAHSRATNRLEICASRDERHVLARSG